ncbi:MAG TPA: gamma-glutamyltransferase, partial [Candidatus Acidoferrales bacterium]|nr:gamma-glutamyltransferase [Candidatus Acidoferrales bacterium]
GCDVEMENRFPGKVRDELAARGHKIELKGAYTSDTGGGQAVMRDFSTGVNYGASDPRKDGQATPEMPQP